jgi:hypothetical protein
MSKVEVAVMPPRVGCERGWLSQVRLGRGGGLDIIELATGMIGGWGKVVNVLLLLRERIRLEVEDR